MTYSKTRGRREAKRGTRLNAKPLTIPFQGGAQGAAELVVLYEVTRDMARQDKLSGLIEMVVGAAGRLLGAQAVGLYRYDEASAELRLMSGKGVLNPPLHKRIKVGEGLAGRVAQTREPLIAPDSALPHAGGSQLAVPMRYRGQLIGVLQAERFDATTQPFSSADANLLELFAAHAASTLYNAELFEQVRAGRERLQTLSRQLLEAREMERRQIARELHDEIGQVLTAVKVNLQTIQLRPEAEPLISDLEVSIDTVDRALAQVRSISLDLRPSVLDDFGLAPALEWLVERHAIRGHFKVQFSNDPLDGRLPASIETACFRVAQEALTNVLRHAKAHSVLVKLSHSEQRLQLLVRDDGVGFNLAAARERATQGLSMGLLGMQEHAALVGGLVTITTAHNEGTEIHADFPTTLAEPLERRKRRRVG